MKRSARKFALFALLSWAGLIVFGYFAARAPRSISESQLEAWRLQQRVLLLEEEVASLKARLQLPSLFDEELIGAFTPLSARLTPIPDLSPTRRSALLDIGSEDGVEQGQGVISQQMLIGRVVKVSRTRCRIMLVDDPLFRVRFAHVPQSPQHALAGEGIAAGGPRVGTLKCAFQRDPMEVVEGDLIVSAGGEGVFPRGVVIGESEPTGGGQFQIRTRCDPLTVREVLVLAPGRGEAPAERPGG